MNKADIIKETVSFYGADPINRRATSTNGSGCHYATRTGKRCAVGRCAQDPEFLESEYEGNTVFGLTQKLGEVGFQSMLKSEYKGHDPDFWAELQDWHDDSDNFTDVGISELGLAQAERLLQRHSTCE